MPESIFKQVSLDILRLHQKTIHTLLATQGCTECEIHDAVYVTLDGRYYVWLPCIPSENTGILLIEDEQTQSSISWVATTREVKQKDSIYSRVINALQHRLQSAKDKFNQASNTHLFEFTPQQGRLTTSSRNLSLSPNDLMKALYPATEKVGEFAL